MRVFTNRWFQRFAKKEGITGAMLKSVVNSIEKGDIDADLGGNVYKQRLAKKGAGKSGGYRVLLCFRKGDKAFFVYGFAKADRDNITKGELTEFRKLARLLLSYSDKSLDAAVENMIFSEIL